MAMPSNTVSAELVRCHLQSGFEELERVASEGHYNTMCIRALGSAVKLLGRGNPVLTQNASFAFPFLRPLLR